METYTDGFVLPVPKDRIDEYRKCAELAGKVWLDHGALQYREWIADHTDVGEDMMSFPQLMGASESETVMFSWITYRDREHRDEVNAKAMADPRLAEFSDGKNLPFNPQRLAYGGFKILVDA